MQQSIHAAIGGHGMMIVLDAAVERKSNSRVPLA
jgi:hypothetical protein